MASSWLTISPTSASECPSRPAPSSSRAHTCSSASTRDGWPGFALGSDEELGIWLLDGTLVASVDWEDGQSGADQSYARVPDVTGGFATVDTPTPGAANQP